MVRLKPVASVRYRSKEISKQKFNYLHMYDTGALDDSLACTPAALISCYLAHEMFVCVYV